MKDVTVLALTGTSPTAIAAPMDIFSSAGELWNRFLHREIEPEFRVRTVSIDGRPVRCYNGLEIIPQQRMEDIVKTDLIVITALSRISLVEPTLPETVQWLCHHYERGARIASICTGAYVLAATGLLDGKTATTHWSMANDFKKRFPRVRFTPEKLITDEGDLYCSAGASAGSDLCLYLVEKFCGHETALRCAKAMVLDLGRDSQAPYSAAIFQPMDCDPGIEAARQWVLENYEKPFRVEPLAAKAGMGRRTFERRFRKATQMSPLLYLRKIRVEAAKRLLESTTHSFDEITCRVGYEDSSSFRKIFTRETGVLPGRYRRKFQSRLYTVYKTEGVL